MDPESKKLLEDTFALAKENNAMLHRVRSIQKWAAFWQTLKVLIVIGIALGAFYFLQPYINKAVDVYHSFSGTVQQVNDNSNAFQEFLKKLKL